MAKKVDLRYLVFLAPPVMVFLAIMMFIEEATDDE